MTYGCVMAIAPARRAGVKSDQIVGRDALAIERRWLGRKRLRRRCALARSRGLWYRTLFDRPDRFARHPIEHEREGLLRQLDHGLDWRTIHGDVGEDGSGRQVIVPQAMVNELVVPDTLTCFSVHADQALSVQSVAEPMPVVHVARRAAQRKIDVPQLFVGADHRPQVGVAAVLPRIPLPGFDAWLVFARNHLEGPSRLARARVERAHIAGRLLLHGRCIRHRRPDDDDITNHQWCSSPAVSRHQRAEAGREVTRPSLPNSGTG